MIAFLEHRIGDRRILRLIRKWLKAGVSEDGVVSETNVGAPQGSVICFAPPPGAHPCGAAFGRLSRSAVFTAPIKRVSSLCLRSVDTMVAGEPLPRRYDCRALRGRFRDRIRAQGRG